MVNLKFSSCTDLCVTVLLIYILLLHFLRVLTLSVNQADFLVSAAVAEFKGPEIFGVVRFAQTHMELARIEANFSGLPPGKHAWAINEFGDLTKGPVSTGKVYNPPTQGSKSEVLINVLSCMYTFDFWCIDTNCSRTVSPCISMHVPLKLASMATQLVLPRARYLDCYKLQSDHTLHR